MTFADEGEPPRFTEDGTERDDFFTAGNNKIWGRGNWVKCSLCLDDAGLPSYHHKNFHS